MSTRAIQYLNKKYSFALMPGDKQLALKQLAKVCKVKRAAMVDTANAEILTGYLVGGISPFGANLKIQKRRRNERDRCKRARMSGSCIEDQEYHRR